MKRIFFLIFITLLVFAGTLDRCQADVPFTEQKLLPGDGAGLDKFGQAVAISGDNAIVGAWGDDDSGDASGSAYIFHFDGINWTQVQKLTADDGDSLDKFGHAVGISGNYAIVGTIGDNGATSGSAYIFHFNGINWVQVQKLTASDGASWDKFGHAVAISGDNIVVGAFGDNDGGELSGAAYLFHYNGTDWGEQQKITAGDGESWNRFGHSVAISGDHCIIGTPGDNDRGGSAGSAYIFFFNGSSWVELEKISAGDGAGWDKFGHSVAISGNYAVVGSPGDDDNGSSSGSAYIFYNDGNSWLELQKVTASDGVKLDRFGQAVTVDGNLVVIGTPGNDDNGISSGAAYVFHNNNSNWEEIQKLLAGDAASSDFFGRSVAVYATHVLVGSYGDDDNGESSGSGLAYTVNISIPVANNLTANPIDEDSVLNGLLTGSDGLDNPLSFSLVSPPGNGLVIINSDGTFTYTPNLNFFGEDSFTFKVNNGSRDSNLATVSITVVAVNDAPVGNVLITGTVTEDQMLTADSSGLADDDGLGTLSYQWQRGGIDIAGATGDTYTLIDPDVGTGITVSANYTDAHGTAESVISTPTSAVVNINDAPAGNVVITGTVAEDQMLTADSSGVTDDDGLGTLSYQWQRDGFDIDGAMGGTYTLGDSDVGAAMAVVVNYTDLYGTPERLTSAATAAVANTNDSPTGSVTITGTVTEDQTLTASNDLSDIDTLGTISYQWQHGGIDIAGATGNTYTLGDPDVGTAIAVSASYTDGHGTAESVTSTATAPVANINDPHTGTVIITGTVIEDQTLTASNDLSDIDGLGALSYQWQRDSVDIVGATESTYTLDDPDVGTKITVLASYTDSHGTAESESSTPTSAVININDAPVDNVLITGSATEDQKLTADISGLSDSDGLGTLRYQWQRDGVAIIAAAGSIYTLDDRDVGAAITVVINYTDLHGTPESLTSSATVPVANLNDPPNGSVTISGMATEDQTLTASNNLSDNDGLGAVSYQWQRNSVDIVGATGGTYTLDDPDVGTVITVSTSYTDGYGTEESVNSPATAAVANINDLPTGNVLITGSLINGHLLTADSSGLTDDDGLGTLSHQWQRDGIDISDATRDTYALSIFDVGATMKVVVTYTDLHGTPESLPSASTIPVADVYHPPTGSVLIAGIVEEDQLLTVDSSGLIDDDGLGPLSYQWQRGGSNIIGATGNTYTLDDPDVGLAMTVVASYTDGRGTFESKSSGATAAVVNVNDPPVGNVVITGIPTKGKSLTADSNELTDDDGLGTFNYQWQRDEVDITGATGSTYTLGASDVGAAINVVVTYTDLHGTTESVTSVATAVVADDINNFWNLMLPAILQGGKRSQ